MLPSILNPILGPACAAPSADPFGGDTMKNVFDKVVAVAGPLAKQAAGSAFAGATFTLGSRFAKRVEDWVWPEPKEETEEADKSK